MLKPAGAAARTEQETLPETCETEMIGAILRWAFRSVLATLAIRVMAAIFPALARLLKILRR